MMQLDAGTWARFAVWMAIGKALSGAQLQGLPGAEPFPRGDPDRPGLLLTLASFVSFSGFAIYFGYGLQHSEEGQGAQPSQSAADKGLPSAHSELSQEIAI